MLTLLLLVFFHVLMFLSLFFLRNAILKLHTHFHLVYCTFAVVICLPGPLWKSLFFRYAAPCRRNELSTDLREPHQIQSPSLSPITHGSSSSSPSSLSPLASTLTRPVFQYFILNLRLGSSANPFLHSSFPPFPFLPDWFHGLSGHLVFLFCSTTGFVCMVCWLSQLLVGFRMHFKSMHFHFVSVTVCCFRFVVILQWMNITSSAADGCSFAVSDIDVDAIICSCNERWPPSNHRQTGTTYSPAPTEVYFFPDAVNGSTCAFQQRRHGSHQCGTACYGVALAG